ncbi:MAG: FliM/FliN family flagellar motor switch protein [Paracoccaceae bacterium]
MGKHSKIEGATPVEHPFIWLDIPSERAVSAELRAVLPDQSNQFEIPFADQKLKLNGPVIGTSESLRFCTTLDVGGQELVMWTHNNLLGFLLQAFEHNPDVSLYGADITPLILEHLAQPLLDRFAQALDVAKVTVLSYRRTQDSPIGDVIPMSTTDEAGVTHYVALSGPTPLLARIAGLFGLAPDQRSRVSTGDIPFNCVLMGQDFEVDAADIVALQPEDVLVLDAAWLNSHGFVLRAAERLSARVTREDGVLRLMTDFHPLKRTNDMPALNRSVDDLPVTVSIELARKDIVLSELDTLSVGDVMSFDEDDLNAVTLTANGAPLGSGVLVKVDDQIAIRLTDTA